MSSTQRLQLFVGLLSYIAYFNTVIAGLITRQMYEMLRHPVLGALTFMIQQETLTATITSVARILQWGGFENDITFDHTLCTGVDPESFWWGRCIFESV